MNTKATPISPTPTLATLSARHQAQIAQQRTPFTLRIHRALSWLKRAEAAGEDDDVAFICLWIGFNAAYAQDLGEGGGTAASERQTFRNFMADLCALDGDKALAKLVWQVFPGPIRVLLNNQYVSAVLGCAQQPAQRWQHSRPLARGV